MPRPKKLIIFIMTIILAAGILTTMSSCNSQQNVPDINKPNAVSAKVVYDDEMFKTTLEIKDKAGLDDLFSLEQQVNRAVYNPNWRSPTWEFTITYQLSNDKTLKRDYIKNDNDCIKQIKKFISHHSKEIISKELFVAKKQNSSTPTQTATK